MSTLQRIFNSFPRSAWECRPGRSAALLDEAEPTTRSVEEGIPTRSVGTRALRILALADAKVLPPEVQEPFDRWRIWKARDAVASAVRKRLLNASLDSLFLLQTYVSNSGVWYFVTLGSIAIGVALLLPRGIWGTVQSRFGLQLLPVGYRLRREG